LSGTHTGLQTSMEDAGDFVSYPSSPFNITMSLNCSPSLNETFLVISTVNSSINISQCQIQTSLPNGVEHMAGDLIWNGSFQ